MDADLLRYLEGMEMRLREHIVGRAQDTEKQLCGNFDGHTLRMREHIDERTHEMEQRLRKYFDQRWHDAETRIIRAFGSCHESAGVRMRKIEADVSNINASTTQQLDAMQSKLLDLETRIINLEGPQGSTARN